MEMKDRIIAIATLMGSDVKKLTDSQGDLSSLNTTAKTNLVAAINELVTLASQPSGAQIDDNATNGATDVVWSVDKIFDAIEAAKTAVKDDLVNGSSSALDTLKELSDALGNDPNFSTTIVAGLNNRVRFDATQTLSAAQKLQACNNIGIGDPDTDFVAAYTAAKNGV